MTTAADIPDASSDNKGVVLRFMQLLDGGELEKLDDVLAPGFQLHLGSTTLDRQQTDDMIRMFYAAFPDFSHNVEDVLQSGEKVVLRARDTATHQGEFQGIPPTGRRVSFGQIAIYRLVDGKIAEVWEEADLAGLMEQLTED